MCACLGFIKLHVGVSKWPHETFFFKCFLELRDHKFINHHLWSTAARVFEIHAHTPIVSLLSAPSQSVCAYSNELHLVAKI